MFPSDRSTSPAPALTLLRQHSPLASPQQQVALLEGESPLPHFNDLVLEHHPGPLRTSSPGLQVLQVNLGKLCNQTCHHCHVDAGPDRREVMDRPIVDHTLRVLRDCHIPTLDITGGAPEMNPHFRYLVHQARQLGCHVIDRSNLTILLAPGYDDLARFLAENNVEIVASLPCYLEENCDRQRGSGVFRRSVEALRRLNDLGYGHPGTGLHLTLVYNPVSATLPPSQEQLEHDYRRELASRYGITFTRLYTITNMPISRFLDGLLRVSQYDLYMQKLIEAYNPAAVDGVMCRTMLSVDWEGYLYDCDFNQMLQLRVDADHPQHIQDLDGTALTTRTIVTGRHCFGCTAGAGSSCQGTLLRAGVEP